MRVVTDKNDRSWNIDLNLGVALKIDQAKIQSVKDDEGNPSTVVLVGEGQRELLIKQLADIYTLLQVAGVMISGQLKPGESVEETFYSALSKDVEFPVLQQAIWDEVSDFFPQMKTLFGQLARVQSELIERSVQLSKKAGLQAQKKLDKVVSEAVQEAEAMLDSAFTEGPP